METKTTEKADQGKQGLQRLESCLWGVFFLGIFLYVWKGIEPHLLYYGFGVFAAYPVFSLDASFLQTTFSTPGGPINALGALLAQAYQLSWFGALIITMGLAVVFLGVRRLLRSAGAAKFADLAWFPVLMVLPIYSYYYEDPLPSLLAVGLSVWTAVLYRALPARRLPPRAAWFGVAFLALYYLVGAAALVFAAIACLLEILLDRRFLVALAQVALAVAGVLVLGRLIFGLHLSAIYTVGTPWDPDRAFELSPLASWLALMLHVWVPVVVAVTVLSQIVLEIDARRVKQAGQTKKGASRKSKSKRTARRSTDPRVLIGLRMLLVTVVTIPCLMFSRTYKHYERALHYAALQRDWDQVLVLAERMKGTNLFTRCGVFDINRALAHEGRTGSELFAFPQDGIGTLLMNFKDMSGMLQHAKSLDLYMDLGCLNIAQKNAYELLDLMGPSPHVIDALIRIHLAKEQYESARILLGSLKKYAGCGRLIRRWQPIVADPNRGQSNSLIQSYRKAMPVRDDAATEISIVTLERLLEDVPDHRLAFEYLMASYMLMHERVDLIAHLSLAKSFGYQELPRHWAEVLLVHSMEMQSSPDIYGWTIDPELKRQFQEILSTAGRAGSDAQAAFMTLAPKYGDSYTFYSMFDQSGLK